MPTVQTRKPTPSSAARERLRRRRQRRRILFLSSCLVLFIGLVVFIVTRFAGQERKPEEEPTAEEPVYFTYWNTQFEADPAYPVSTLREEDFVLDENGRMRCVAPDVRAHAGIDVSEHNGEIDWEAVAADGVEFVMLRVGNRGFTEGELYEDARFRENYEGAKAAGLKVGAYFFSQALSVEEAEEEAKFTLDVLKGLKLDLPVAYDWELIGQEDARADSIDRETLTDCAAAFCSRIAKKFDAMIYTNAFQCYYLLDLSRLSDYPIWFAGYADTPIFYYRYVIWQYSDAGRVAGIEQPVDLDLCFFDP